MVLLHFWCELANYDSKFLLIKYLCSKNADKTRDPTIYLLHPLKDITHTLTVDNGI